MPISYDVATCSPWSGPLYCSINGQHGLSFIISEAITTCLPLSLYASRGGGWGLRQWQKLFCHRRRDRIKTDSGGRVKMDAVEETGWVEETRKRLRDDHEQRERERNERAIKD